MTLPLEGGLFSVIALSFGIMLSLKVDTIPIYLRGGVVEAVSIGESLCQKSKRTRKNLKSPKRNLMGVRNKRKTPKDMMASNTLS